MARKHRAGDRECGSFGSLGLNVVQTADAALIVRRRSIGSSPSSVAIRGGRRPPSAYSRKARRLGHLTVVPRLPELAALPVLQRLSAVSVLSVILVISVIFAMPTIRKDGWLWRPAGADPLNMIFPDHRDGGRGCHTARGATIGRSRYACTRAIGITSISGVIGIAGIIGLRARTCITSNSGNTLNTSHRSRRGAHKTSAAKCRSAALEEGRGGAPRRCPPTQST